MIKLTKSQKPEYLSPEKVTELTALFQETKESVWNDKRIKAPLLESSHGKCAYCETVLTDPGIYMEVEHFKHKSSFPDLVVDWDNLLPSCKRCNGTKNDKDKLIINPYINDPKMELVFDNYCIFGSTELGKETESAVDLNEEVLMVKRFKICNLAFLTLIETASEFKELPQLDHYKRRRIKRILSMAQPYSPYSAAVSTIIHSTREYGELKSRFISEGLWTDELERLHEISLKIALPRRVR
ncbi:HNH endonuclease [Acinetobacter baumannii]|nr:HNH endonuclease [Acinetobacter baumannii]MDC4932079.1 HNH endonuclease [Acinetobacter baumannii]